MLAPRSIYHPGFPDLVKKEKKGLAYNAAIFEGKDQVLIEKVQKSVRETFDTCSELKIRLSTISLWALYYDKYLASLS